MTAGRRRGPRGWGRWPRWSRSPGRAGFWWAGGCGLSPAPAPRRAGPTGAGLARPRAGAGPPGMAARGGVTAYLGTTIPGSPAGKPVLSWHFDRAAIDAEAAADGWYALTANLEPGQASPEEVLRRYKGQHVVERRYGEFKGPLAGAPLSLKTNRRITALITVICLALLIFCLAGRQVRNALAPHGEMMTGLPAYGPAPPRPTGSTVFQALADLRLTPAYD